MTHKIVDATKSLTEIGTFRYNPEASTLASDAYNSRTIRFNHLATYAELCLPHN
jgi:hypothetical protein